jgi:hypothetical protein
MHNEALRPILGALLILLLDTEKPFESPQAHRHVSKHDGM